MCRIRSKSAVAADTSASPIAVLGSTACVVELFAVNRPLTSSKLLRRPTRGAVGNGLRVVTGGVIGSGGQSRSRAAAGATSVSIGYRRNSSSPRVDRTSPGTASTVRFGPGLPADADKLAWARTAAGLAGPAARPPLSHPRWYYEPAWYELTRRRRRHCWRAAGAFGIASDDGRPARADSRRGVDLPRRCPSRSSCRSPPILCGPPRALEVARRRHAGPRPGVGSSTAAGSRLGPRRCRLCSTGRPAPASCSVASTAMAPPRGLPVSH